MKLLILIFGLSFSFCIYAEDILCTGKMEALVNNVIQKGIQKKKKKKVRILKSGKLKVKVKKTNPNSNLVQKVQVIKSKKDIVDKSKVQKYANERFLLVHNPYTFANPDPENEFFRSFTQGDTELNIIFVDLAGIKQFQKQISNSPKIHDIILNNIMSSSYDSIFFGKDFKDRLDLALSHFYDNEEVSIESFIEYLKNERLVAGEYLDEHLVNSSFNNLLDNPNKIDKYIQDHLNTLPEEDIHIIDLSVRSISLEYALDLWENSQGSLYLDSFLEHLGMPISKLKYSFEYGNPYLSIRENLTQEQLIILDALDPKRVQILQKRILQDDQQQYSMKAFRPTKTRKLKTISKKNYHRGKNKEINLIVNQFFLSSKVKHQLRKLNEEVIRVLDHHIRNVRLVSPNDEVLKGTKSKIIRVYKFKISNAQYRIKYEVGIQDREVNIISITVRKIAYEDEVSKPQGAEQITRLKKIQKRRTRGFRVHRHSRSQHNF